MTRRPHIGSSSAGRLGSLLLVVAASIGFISCGGDDGSDESPDLAVSDDAANQTSTTAAEAEPTTTVPPTTTEQPTTTAAPLPDLELVGPGQYEVGVTTIQVDEGSDRPLTVDVWFPLADGEARAAHQYTFLTGIYYESAGAFSAELQDASSDGPFPLVVYSHGSGGQRFIHSNYTETIASHGYVVVAPDHTGNTLIEQLTGGETDIEKVAFDRPNDLSAVLDGVLGTDETVSVDSTLTALVAPETVVVTGHSLGGFTSYAMVSGFESALGTFEADERVGAIITLAPAASEEFLSDDLLAAVDVPHMVIVGTDDKTTPIDPHVERPWALTTGAPNYRIELMAGEHLTFTDLCDYVTFLPELGTVPDFIVTTLDERSTDGCSPGDLPIERAQELTNTFAVAFLEQFTAGATGIDETLVTIPDDVTFQSR